MKRNQLVVGVLLVLVAGLLARGQLGQIGLPKMPTQADIQKMIEAKAYHPALRAIAQVMPVAASANPGGYDKYGLLMMRGECMLQGQDGYSAGLAFDQAAQAAGSLQQNEAARAMALLIKKSPGLVYRPRGNTNMTKYSLLDPAERQKAMVALLGDELPALETQANQAIQGKALPPIFALVPSLRDLHALEMQATGEDKQTMGIAQVMADRVNDLIANELNRVGEQIKSIQNAANSVVEWGSGNFQTVDGQTRWVQAPGASGLTADQRQALRENVTYLGQIAETCDNLYAMARKYERQGLRWQELGNGARQLKNQAAAIYDNE